MSSIPTGKLSKMTSSLQHMIGKLNGKSKPKSKLSIRTGNPSAKISVNSRTKKELLIQACRFGFFIRRIVNWAVAARGLYPDKHILATKNDYKSAYQRGHLHWLTALQTCTQLPDEDLIIINHHATSHFRRSTMPVRIGGNIRINL
jgi:hypothetical protein